VSGGVLAPDVEAGGRRERRSSTGLADWFGRAEAIADLAGGRSAVPPSSSWFRIGDRHLRFDSEGGVLLDAMESQYRDCLVSAPAPAPGDVRCDARRLPGTPLVCLTFEGEDLPDPLEAAGTPFRIVRGLARYEQVPGPRPGQRALVDREHGGRPIAAGDGRRLFLDLDAAPAELATDCVVNLVQAAQRDVLFLHAASFGVGGAGALLVGWSQSGKSTTALALAARGHAFLGDDVAAVRTRTRELLPFPKVASLRPGPFVRSLEARLRATRHAKAVGDDGQERALVSMRELFPTSEGRVLPLRFAFLLDGFGPRPKLTRYRPRIEDVRRLRPVVNGGTPSWGHSPGRDLMRFLAVVNVLSRIECHLVELGPAEETAAAIERIMEGECH